MKIIMTYLGILILSSSYLSAQDLLIYRNGDTLSVEIVRSTPDIVEFKYENEELINEEYKNALLKIVYESGREEFCSSESNLVKINGIDDWEKVILTTNHDDVRGLTKVGEVVGKSGWGGLLAQRAGNKDARKQIKKQAAKLNASLVLIQQDVSGFGGAKIVGVAYK